MIMNSPIHYSLTKREKNSPDQYGSAHHFAKLTPMEAKKEFGGKPAYKEALKEHELR